MDSNYEGFYVMKRDATGALEAVPGVDVTIYDVDSDSDVGTVTTDSNGYIAGGTLTGYAPGSRIRFRVPGWEGLAGSVTQITT